MTSYESKLSKRPLQPAAGAEARPSDDPFAVGLRGFGPLGLFAIIVIVAAQILLPPLGALLVLLWAVRSRTPWREIGYVRPRSWVGGLVVGIAFGVAFKLLMKAVVMPLFGADPINQAYHFLTGNRAAAARFVPVLIIKAGFGEETFFRGYMFERLGKLFGSSVGAKVLIVLLTSAMFAAGHYADQGLAGVEQAAITGLAFGTIFAVMGRLWMIIFAHIAYDLAALAIIYLNLESAVAHLVFK